MAKPKKQWVNPQNTDLSVSGKLFPGPKGKKPIAPLKGPGGPKNAFKSVKK